MPKKFSQKLFIFIIAFSAIGFLFSMAIPTQAQSDMPKFKNPLTNLQVKIPGLEKLAAEHPATCNKVNEETKCQIPWIGVYISSLYKYAIGIVGILAAVVLMAGGVIWLTAGGNQTRVGEAKSWIGASLTGLIIALTSYMILYQVNPALTKFRPIEMKIVKETPTVTTANCDWHDSQFNCAENYIKSDGKCSGDAPDGTSDEYSYKQICCCVACNPNTECNACSNCAIAKDYEYGTLDCKHDNSCKLNTSFIEKLRKAGISLGNTLTITEAWPPTENHESSCHKNGTCADIGIGGDTSVNNIGKIYAALVNGGITSLQYEVTAENGCATYSSISGLKCVYNSNASGSHFHVNN